MKKLFLLVCALILTGLLLLVAACAGGSASQPAPTHILTPTVASLGMVPQDCLPGPTPKKVTAQFGPLIGGSPIWAAGFAGPHATIPLSPHDPYTPYGWTVKIFWGIEPNYTHAVTLHGENLRTGARLYFNVTGQPTPAPVLDPAAVGTPINQWKDFPSHLFIPTAGCYALEATWPEDSGGSPLPLVRSQVKERLEQSGGDLQSQVGERADHFRLVLAGVHQTSCIHSQRSRDWLFQSTNGARLPLCFHEPERERTV